MTVLELAMEKHIEEYGSFLWCPERNTLCSFMERMWTAGERCTDFRGGCILDDPEYQELQRTIAENRRRRQEADKKKKREHKPYIRDQRNMIKSFEEEQLEKIHSLEEQSWEAYRNNWPKRGEELLYKAMFMRRELKAWQNERRA